MSIILRLLVEEIAPPDFPSGALRSRFPLRLRETLLRPYCARDLAVYDGGGARVLWLDDVK